MAHDVRKLMQLLQLLKGSGGRRSSWQLIVALLALVAVYVLLRPTVERTVGLELPHLVEWNASSAPSTEDDLPFDTSPRLPTESTTQQSPNRHTLPPTKPPERTNSPSRSHSDSTPTTEVALSSFLSRIGNNTFESPAGLIYKPGSAHGHRLKHIMAHSVDDPDRPGQHGVFYTTNSLEIFQLIDEAYEQALTGSRTEVEHEGRRTAYTINLRKKIGTIGGQSGNRRGNPAARHLQLVLDGKNVITAYPIRR